MSNIVGYKNRWQYFYSCLDLITHNFSNDELKNTFNVSLPQFLKEDKKYKHKTIYCIFEDEYDWVMDKLIKHI